MGFVRDFRLSLRSCDSVEDYSYFKVLALAFLGMVASDCRRSKKRTTPRSWPRGLSHSMLVFSVWTISQSTLSFRSGASLPGWSRQRSRDASHAPNLRQRIWWLQGFLSMTDQIYQTSSPRQELPRAFKGTDRRRAQEGRKYAARAPLTSVCGSAFWFPPRSSSIDSVICFLSWLRRFHSKSKRPS